MMTQKEIRAVLNRTPGIEGRIMPFNIVDKSNSLPTINSAIRKIEAYERRYGGAWGVALLYQHSLGGIYKLMSREEYKQCKNAVVEPVSFWPKSYFLNLRQKLLQDT